jgi:hypothetical protein
MKRQPRNNRYWLHKLRTPARKGQAYLIAVSHQNQRDSGDSLLPPHPISLMPARGKQPATKRLVANSVVLAALQRDQEGEHGYGEGIPNLPHYPPTRPSSRSRRLGFESGVYR